MLKAAALRGICACRPPLDTHRTSCFSDNARTGELKNPAFTCAPRGPKPGTFERFREAGSFRTAPKFKGAGVWIPRHSTPTQIFYRITVSS
jgi:hypothetical protein